MVSCYSTTDPNSSVDVLTFRRVEGWVTCVASIEKKVSSRAVGSEV